MHLHTQLHTRTHKHHTHSHTYAHTNTTHTHTHTLIKLNYLRNAVRGRPRLVRGHASCCTFRQTHTPATHSYTHTSNTLTRHIHMRDAVGGRPRLVEGRKLKASGSMELSGHQRFKCIPTHRCAHTSASKEYLHTDVHTRAHTFTH